MIIVRSKHFSNKTIRDQEKNDKLKKDTIRLSSGIASGSILGSYLGKKKDLIDKSIEIEDYLRKYPDKNKKIIKMTGGNKKLSSAVLNEVASVITPETVKKMKKGAKAGAVVGGIISGSNVIRKRIQKDYSDTDLPNDWNDNDKKFLDTVEKGKRKSKILLDNIDRNRNLIYSGVGVTTGLVSGYKKGRLYKGSSLGKNLIGKQKFSNSHPEILRAGTESVKNGLIGLGISVLGADAQEVATGGKCSSSKFKRLGEKERKRIDGHINKYKKIKTSEEREKYRKKLGSRF